MILMNLFQMGGKKLLDKANCTEISRNAHSNKELISNKNCLKASSK